MRFGLFGGVARAKGENGDSQSYGAYVNYVLAAERLGFDSNFVVEHHFTGFGQLSASLSFLAYLAGLTSRMRLGTAVTVMPWHNPVLLAEQAALVDVVSNGRLDFGVGRGYRPGEFHGFCIDQSEAQERYEEGLALVLRSWTSRERFSHEGRFWKFSDIIVEPQCVQDPHPPIWVAGGSEGSIRAAAKRRQNLLLDQYGNAELTKQRVSWYRDQLVRDGHAPDSGCIALTRGLLLTKNNDPELRRAEINRRIQLLEALQRASGISGAASPQRASSHQTATSQGSTLLDGILADPVAATESATILGPPEECIRRLKELESIGVDIVLFNDTWGGVQRLELFAREVMPAFQEAAKPEPKVAVDAG